jgi:hypothetical protein
MHFAITTSIFFAESVCMLPKPKIICTGFSCPNGARMVDHSATTNVCVAVAECLVFFLLAFGHNWLTVKNMVSS